MTTKLHIRYIIDLDAPSAPYMATAKLAEGYYLATRAGSLRDGAYAPSTPSRFYGTYAVREVDFEVEARDGYKPGPLSRMPLN